MTALKEFDRLEATGLWRATPEDQRREVIVSLGDATLTITSIKGEVLAHWSLAAVNRSNGSAIPAIYHPDGDPGETLELPEGEEVMIKGVDRLLKAIEKRRPRPGKLRLILGLGFGAVIAAGAVFWLPGALERYAVNVVPMVKRAEIGEALLTHMTRVTGQPCRAPEALRSLDRLALRILGPGHEGDLIVVPQGVAESAHLPGGIVMLNRSVVEDFEDPDVAAGYVLAEKARARARDPLGELLDYAGLMASLKLITTGLLPEDTLSAYAETLLKRKDSDPSFDTLLAAFAKAEVRSTPYAYARDITGESTLPLIEADPRAGQGSREVLSDADWVRLQGICGG
ncbi:hypothetical protein [Tropicibacter oceani]|uniref:Uncharacterized protein n=1 Tax=Tropicibacter oceani TaxID=3058420 RepID=A0ABY8QN99_9RHOB|nr:hypothetical protein [Tropicibacter oceani]WGW05513.1 hypothetical protein QF118_08190 [Tropicibacter oceani]